jgi:hypothetical protein
MNQLQAARDTITLAREHGMHEFPYHADLDESIQYHHLEGMLRRMEEMPEASEAKFGRWLGWMQCAVVIMTPATLENMKQINVRNSDGPKISTGFDYKVTAGHAYCSNWSPDTPPDELEGWVPDESLYPRGLNWDPVTKKTICYWKRQKD